MVAPDLVVCLVCHMCLVPQLVMLLVAYLVFHLHLAKLLVACGLYQLIGCSPGAWQHHQHKLVEIDVPIIVLVGLSEH